MVKKWTYDEAYELLKPYKSDFFMSIMLAQFNLESVMGTSELAVKANNFTGHKTTGWNGKVYKKDTIEDDGKGNKFVAKSEPFRHYTSPSEWAKHHASWLQRLPKVYAKAINAKTVEEQAKALQGTYATDTGYAKKLLDIIERDGLKKYDTKKGNDTMSFSRPKMTDRRKQALGYPGSGAYSKRSVSAIKNIVWHYTATKHEGNGATIIQNHERYWRNTHGWDIGGYHYYIDRQGNIFWNYDLEIVTYGAGRLNPQLMHISCEASSASNYTSAQVKARETLTLWLMSEPLKHLGGQDMRGHKEIPYNSTSCPGYSVAELNQYRKDLTAKLKSGSKPVDPNNPQGMATTPFKEYKEPRLPFDELKKGDTVTLDTNWQWADLTKRQLLASPRYKDLLGTKDKIAEVIKLDKPGNHSKVAYRLEKYNSIILEEYLEESKRSWELKPDDTESPEEVKQKYEELQEGEYIDNDGVVWVWNKK